MLFCLSNGPTYKVSKRKSRSHRSRLTGRRKVSPADRSDLLETQVLEETRPEDDSDLRHLLGELRQGNLGSLNEKARQVLLSLTKRQREVLALLVFQYSESEAAQALGISKRTVERDVAAIRRYLPNLSLSRAIPRYSRAISRMESILKKILPIDLTNTEKESLPSELQDLYRKLPGRFSRHNRHWLEQIGMVDNEIQRSNEKYRRRTWSGDDSIGMAENQFSMIAGRRRVRSYESNDELENHSAGNLQRTFLGEAIDKELEYFYQCDPTGILKFLTVRIWEEVTKNGNPGRDLWLLQDRNVFDRGWHQEALDTRKITSARIACLAKACKSCKEWQNRYGGMPLNLHPYTNFRSRREDVPRISRRDLIKHPPRKLPYCGPMDRVSLRHRKSRKALTMVCEVRWDAWNTDKFSS